MKKTICTLLILCLILALFPCAALADASDVLGVKDGRTYTNEAMGFQVTLPKGWRILGDEEALKLIGIGLDAVGSDAKDTFTQLLEGSAQIFDLYAVAQDNSGESINIGLQNLNALQASVMTEETILDANEASLEPILLNAGMKDIRITRSTCTFAGEERGCLDVSMSVSGVTLYERIVFVLADGYFATITSASLDKDRSAEILDLFEACPEAGDTGSSVVKSGSKSKD